MAELTGVGRPSRRRMLTILVGSRIRAQLSYRSSFVLDVITAFATGALEFTELYVLLSNAPVLGGLTLLQVALVFAMANLGFALGDLVCGQLDQMNVYLREGKLEALLVRPQPLMLQLITADLQLRRAGRALVSIVVGIVVLTQLDLTFDLAATYLLIITPLAGAAIYGAMFALAGGCQFWLVDGPEFTNAFTYGGAYAGQIPASTLFAPVRVFFTFVIPATATAYLPALLIFDLPGPTFLPSGLGWCTPLFAVWIWVLAMIVWRAGIRHFTGAGG